MVEGRLMIVADTIHHHVFRTPFPPLCSSLYRETEFTILNRPPGLYILL